MGLFVEKSKSERMLAFSLFSGAGGMDCGVDAAGFETVCAIEMDKHCVETLRVNDAAAKGRRARKEIIHDDIRAVSPAPLMRGLGLQKGDIRLLYGGPPCQPFSAIGKKLGLADERGGLVFEMIRFAKALVPDTVMIEQVPGIWRANDGRIVAEIVEELRKINYTGFSFGILNAADYGVAQNRKRFMLIASRLGFGFPSCNASSPPSVHDVIGDLPPPPPARAESPAVPNHIDVTPARDRQRIDIVPEGKWLGMLAAAPADIRRGLTRKDSTKYRRMARNLPANTLRCGEIFYHPTVSRYLTPREYMRIHGYPDSYLLRGPIRRRTGCVRDLDQHRQVANSVPPPLAKAVAKKIRQAICQ